jgi:hypothetical protein
MVSQTLHTCRLRHPFRSSPRGAPRDARVTGTPLRGPRIWMMDWIPSISAFTRVSTRYARE